MNSLICDVWYSFIENCNLSYKPGDNITMDEYFLTSKTRYPFTEFMASKREKYQQK